MPTRHVVFFGLSAPANAARTIDGPPDPVLLGHLGDPHAVAHHCQDGVVTLYHLDSSRNTRATPPSTERKGGARGVRCQPNTCRVSAEHASGIKRTRSVGCQPDFYKLPVGPAGFEPATEGL
jgi:hypothetical protein